MVVTSAPLTRRIGNLPAELTSFVGRKRELAEVRRLQNISRLVTMTGAGGVGKTRLALRVAADQHRAFDAVWLIDLAALDDPELVPETVAATMGVRDQPERSSFTSLVQALSARRTLLVLDNCEHLRDACASLADRLLRAVPDLRIIATSRQSLGVIGEHQMKVAPLALPEPGRPLSNEALELYDGVRLFLERAAAVVPGFRLTADNKDAVVELCRRLDGIPLAIELAAVRLRALSVEALLERLDDRYALLASGSPTLAPRQRTLHALVDWSFQLLSPPERTLCSRISIFLGHFDLEAVEAVCTGDGIERQDVLDLVDALLDKSLLLREEHDGRVRYRMLETLREFGRLRLEGPDERRALARRHRDHYLRLVERAEAEWFGPAQLTWHTRLRLELAHLRAAMEFCLGEQGEAETGLRMASLLFHIFWMPRAKYSEGRYWLDRLLEATPGPTAVRAEALCDDAFLAFWQGDATTGELRVGEGRALAEKLNDARILAWASVTVGVALHQRADHARAAVVLEEAVAGLDAAAGEGVALVVGLFALGAAAGFSGDPERAVRLIQRSLAITERHGECYMRSWVLGVYAIQVWQRGDNARAASLARESVRVGRGFDDRLAIGTSIEALGWIMQSEGRHAAAARMLGAAAGACRTAGISPLWMRQHGEFHERCVNALRERMGERALDRALREGERLTLEDAIAEALGEPADARGTEDRGEGPREAAEPAASPLTRRESEIAELIAQGMSNRDISSALVIALRTTEGHVEHILSKLGFSSRAQIAAWVTARKAGGQDGGDRGGATPPPHPR